MAIPVFFEVTTLIAASLREFQVDEEFQVEHEYYGESKGLVNLIRKGRIGGIITTTVEDEANKHLEQAILEELKEKEKDIKQNKDKYRAYSTLLDSIQRNFKNNIRLMDILRTDEEEVRKILNEEVTPMYEELLTKGQMPPLKTYSGSSRFVRVAIESTKLTWRRYQETFKKLEQKSIMPDVMDRIMLSEAIYLKRHKFKKQKFFLASLDNHFSGFREPYTNIPIEIKRRFSIECKTPRELLQEFCK